MAIDFGCDPARVADLTKTTWKLIEQFKETAPSSSQVAEARLALLRDLESNLQQNGYLVNRLALKYLIWRGRLGGLQPARALRSAHAGSNPRRRAPLSEHEAVRAGHATAREGITAGIAGIAQSLMKSPRPPLTGRHRYERADESRTRRSAASRLIAA